MPAKGDFSISMCRESKTNAAAESKPLLERLRHSKPLRVACVSVPEAGHLVPTAQIAQALARCGHQVQLVTLACGAGKVAKACAHAGCEVRGLVPELEAADSGRGQAGVYMANDQMARMFVYYDDCLKEPLRVLLAKDLPDLIVADFVTPCAWEVAECLGIPTVLNFPSPLSMTQMLEGTLSLAVMKMRTSPLDAYATYKLLGSVKEAMQSHICLFNTFFGLDAPQRLRPNHFITGSTAPRHIGKVQKTSCESFNEWLQWVRQERLQIVYVTMGSMQKLTPSQVRALYEGLASLNSAVAWSLKADQQAFLPVGDIKALPKRFLVQSWMPQAEAMQLPEVAVIITHCGFGGLNEAITAGKPLIATPFRADQPMNAKLAQQQGMCEILDTSCLEASSVATTVTKVLKDSSYAMCAQRMQKQLLETGGVDACVEILEALAASGHSLQPLAPSKSKKAQVAWSSVLGLGAALLGSLVLMRALKATG